MINILSETENDNLFGTFQITTFINFLWEDYYFAIFNKIFLHYCRFFVCTIIYLTYFLRPWQEKAPGTKFAEIILVMSMALDVFSEIAIEVI